MAQRLQTADPVAAAKWINGGAITDPARVQQVLAAISSAAGSRGLPTDFVRSVFAEQINANEAIQYGRFAGWKLDPASAPAWAPELGASRDSIDNLNTVIIDEIGQQFPVLRSADCPALLESARSSVADERNFDDLQRRALGTATGSYCIG